MIKDVSKFGFEKYKNYPGFKFFLEQLSKEEGLERFNKVIRIEDRFNRLIRQFEFIPGGSEKIWLLRIVRNHLKTLVFNLDYLDEGEKNSIWGFMTAKLKVIQHEYENWKKNERRK